VRFDDRIHQSGGFRVKGNRPAAFSMSFSVAYFTYMGILALARPPELWTLNKPYLASFWSRFALFDLNHPKN
jgi:hypothetical protein